MADPDALTSAIASKSYATVAADTNLLAEVPTGMAAAVGSPVRRVRVGGAGDLSVKYATGATDTIPSLAAGESIDGEIVALLLAGTTATKVTVFW